MSVMSRKIPVTFDRRSSWTVCFRRVSRRGIYGENGGEFIHTYSHYFSIFLYYALKTDHPMG